MLDFNSLAQQCAPNVHPVTLQAVVRTESGFNPFAIGVVAGHLLRQPRDRAEAIATARALDARGINFSLGLGQVNRTNLAHYGLTYETAFDVCANLKAGADILHRCYTQAAARMGTGDRALRAAISCYYSGNFTRGLAAAANGTSYVQRVSANAQPVDTSTSVVPAIPVVMDRAQAGGPVRVPSVVAHRVGAAGKRVAISDAPQARPSWDAFGDFGCDSDSCK
ncbi:lytic transglycosylase domain-containing protein [Paraburkholderia phymatum]|uniref:lytic transglycosylase domain-containing protein n=1 Tax=Paraburkholderia phymatum TaxID=148447 RepID=UPI00317DB32D